MNRRRRWVAAVKIMVTGKRGRDEKVWEMGVMGLREDVCASVQKPQTQRLNENVALEVGSRLYRVTQGSALNLLTIHHLSVSLSLSNGGFLDNILYAFFRISASGERWGGVSLSLSLT